jgi:hypothetical protein
MGISIVPITAVTGSDNPASQISVNATNSGFQKITQTSAGLLGSTASGDASIQSLSSGQIFVGNSGNAPTAVTPSGDVTITNAGVTAIGANKVTLSQLATITSGNFLARTTSATGNVESLTGAQATALLSNVVGDSGSGGTKGLVPAASAGDAAAGKFLKADGTWSTTPGGTAYDMVSSLANAEVSISAAGTTGTMNKMHVCSGTSANYSVTLPTPSAGSMIAFRMAPALTKLVTLDAGSGKTIDGTQTRIMWAGESCILLGVNSTTWVKVAGRSIPMTMRSHRVTDQSLTVGSWNAITLTVSDYAGPAAMWDSGNGRCSLPRPGVYLATSGGYVSAASGTLDLVYFATPMTGSIPNYNQAAVIGGTSVGNFTDQVVTTLTTDYISTNMFPHTASSATAIMLGAGGAYLMVSEQVQW